MTTTMAILAMTTVSRYLSAMWKEVAPALGNHLWQSTLFAIAAGLLTLLLRKNQARARYGLWLAASLKFLVPFALLVNIGTHLAWSHRPAGTNAGLYLAMQEVSQPFISPISITLPISPAAPTIPFQSLIDLLPFLLPAVWFTGFAVILAVWYVRWRSLSAVMRDAIPAQQGREVETLRRLEKMAEMQNPITLLLSEASMEPGIFGIARPVLLWPQGISARLDGAHLESILAHEVCHVRRRDNLAAAMHMIVQAIFWFHPLVWWLGARLVEERERACDEEVLRLGNPPHLYAESILKVCEFCVESPLACVSGVTGADLKKRIVRIMTESMVRKLDFRKKVLLISVGLLAIAAPIVLGLSTTRPRILAQLTLANGATVQPFEVVSIKPSKPDDDRIQLAMLPDKFATRSQTIKEVIQFAYDIKSDKQLSGGPSWISSEKYDIEAKEDEVTAAKLQKLPMEEHANQIRLMVQAMLADRFKLKVSHETQEIPVYALVVAKGGPKMKEEPPASTPDAAHPRMFIQFLGPGQLAGTNIGNGLLADVLSRQPELGRLVVDETGLKGNYDWTLKWTPEQSDPMFRGPASGPPTTAPPSDASGPSIFTALEEQLGLKLEARKGPVEVLVIDSVERPSPN